MSDLDLVREFAGIDHDHNASNHGHGSAATAHTNDNNNDSHGRRLLTPKSIAVAFVVATALWAVFAFKSITELDRRELGV